MAWFFFLKNLAVWAFGLEFRLLCTGAGRLY